MKNNSTAFLCQLLSVPVDVVPTHQAIAGGKKPEARIRLGHFCAKEFWEVRKFSLKQPNLQLRLRPKVLRRNMVKLDPGRY